MPWKYIGLAGLLLLGCDFGSEGGSAPPRLWLFRMSMLSDLAAEPLPEWKSDSLGLMVEGDSLEIYRNWNGCYHPIAKVPAREFLSSPSFSAETVEGPGGDSLRMTYHYETERDTLRTVTLGVIPGACLSEEPIAKITVKRNDFDVAAYFRPADSLRITLDYAYTPEIGEAREFHLRMEFQDELGAPSDLVRVAMLPSPEGTVRIAIAAESLSSRWRTGQAIGYTIQILYRRTDIPDYYDILSLPYRIVKASYLPDP